MDQAEVGTKKQKLSSANGHLMTLPNCSSVEDAPPLSLNGSLNGTLVQPHVHPNGNLLNPKHGMIISAEMCYFCFDVLYSHLRQGDDPKQPIFSNDSL